MGEERPLIVGVGGTAAPRSSTGRVLRHVLREVEARGGRTLAFDGPSLDLPMYPPGSAARAPGARALVEALRCADGVVIASPGYHGTVSGLVKNALDYVQDLAGDSRPYLDGRAVGLVAVAAGWQACVSTLATLRTVAHALRGWPTPIGVTVNSLAPVFDAGGEPLDPALLQQLGLLADQLTGFARAHARGPPDRGL